MTYGWARRHALCAFTIAGLLGVPGIAAASPASPPAVGDVTAAPGAVDVTEAPVPVVVRARLADADGVATARAVLGDAPATPMVLESGTPADGTWAATVNVPVDARTATLTVSVTGEDTTGESSTASGTPLAVTSDTVAPAYATGTATPAAVDVTNGPAQVTVGVTASDAGSGVVSAVAYAAGVNAPLAAVDGGWLGLLTVPADAVPGAHTVEVLLTDAAGNETRRAVGGLRVTSATGDLTPPVLAWVTAAPGAVDVGAHDAVVTVDARLTDAGSGVGEATVAVGGSAFGTLRLVSGDAYDGVWSGAVTVPAFTPRGGLDAYVVAQDAAGNSAAPISPDSLTVSDTPPAAPAGVTVVAEGPGAVRVSWSAPPPNGGSDVEGYDVSLDGGAATVLDGATRSTVLSDLADGTRHLVRVGARNAAGYGPTATADALGGLVVTPGDASLRLDWSGGAGTEYVVRAAPPGGTSTVTRVIGSTALVPGLVNGVTYDVSVEGLATSTGTPRTVPGAPRITAVTPRHRSAVVTWAKPASDGGAPVSHYEVTTHPSGRVLTVPGTTATVPSLVNGVPVTFTVVAVNAAGRGPASAASRTVVPRQPAKMVVVTQPASKVVHGTGSSVRAAMTTDAGIAIPNARIELWARIRPSTAWKRVTYGTTSSTGHVTLRTTLPASAALLLRHQAVVLSAQDVSVRPVFVATKVTGSAARIRLGGTVVARGSVAPAHPIGSAVQLQRYVSGSWRTVATGRMTSTTVYRVTWKPGASGTFPVRVVKPADTDHATGASPTWSQRVDPENAADIAKQILADGSIKLETTHDSGIRDYAHARQNVVDVAAGRLARRSAYQNAPGGYTALDLRLLRALRHMGRLGSVTVSEIAGGSHSRGSTHYYGRGLDISWVNGTHVGPGSSYRMAVDACKAYGAVRVFSPSYDPYGGHSHHVHCDW